MPIKLNQENRTGCKPRHPVCSDRHEGGFNPKKARLRVRHGHSEARLKTNSQRCIFCRKCQKTCPVEAISNNGRMIVDEDLCIGCGLCVTTCPRGVISMNQDQKPVIRHP